MRLQTDIYNCSQLKKVPWTGGIKPYSVFFGKCQKVSIYKGCLICEFMFKNGLFLSLSLGDFSSYKLKFSEYLRKNWKTILKNQPKVWNILKIHWKYGELEVAVRDAFEDVQ